MSTPAPITIGSHVSPLGTIRSTEGKTLRSGERYEVVSISEHFATLAPPDDPDGPQQTVQLHEIELW